MEHGEENMEQAKKFKWYDFVADTLSITNQLKAWFYPIKKQVNLLTILVSISTTNH
jgi:hypothetical protein